MTQLDALLAQIQQKFAVNFDPMDVDGMPLQVLSITNMTEHLDGLLAQKAIHDPLKDLPLWAKVWPASFILGRFLRKLEPQGKTLLELGAGTGTLGLLASRYGFSSVCISDIVEDALLFAKANVLKNSLEECIDVRRVDIKDSRATLGDTRFDMIAASEILYLEDLHRPLIKCLQRHLAVGGKAILCTDMARRRPRFFKQAAKLFTIKEMMVGVKGKSVEDGVEKEEKRVYVLHVLEPK